MLWIFLLAMAAAVKRRNQTVEVYDNPAIVLTDEDFQNGRVLDGLGNVTGQWLIKFYAPWCPHCQKLENPWNEFANRFANHSVQVGKVDCTINERACQHIDQLDGFPGLFYLEGGNATEYHLRRNIGNFSDYLENE